MSSLKAATIKPPMSLEQRRQMMLAMIRSGRFIQEIVSTTGYCEQTVRRCAEFYMLPVYRKRNTRKCISGAVYVRRRQAGGMEKYQTLCVYIPASACHAAGWQHGQELTFTVEEGTLTLKAQVSA